ncbi:hypothetical protein PHABIO_184 [Pseudomonas phage Phabio]|uniref:Uncharacterized protein n=1 Tax=Pseudomonas phage Phabio TaxID=2006668 RepID=A0A1Y0SWF8_9CAUD|nr:hypothetical protein MZD05_gp184 [Pseudomonas phage Phabio]ARV76815.1 hypothetical protein PHABIO_184 [Pseudomonas phage Phabio]
MSDCTTPLHQRLVDHVRFCTRNRQSSFIGAFVAPETVDLIHNGIIDLVAEIEGWLQPINYSYNTFKTANQTLYFRFGIMVEVCWRQPCTLQPFLEQDVEKYTKLFFEWKPTTSAVEDGY